MPGQIIGADPTLKPPIPKLFGSRWYMDTIPGEMTRLYRSIGKTFSPSSTSEVGHSDFDDEMIFKDIKLCNLVNGEVTAYEGDAEFTRTPTTGDVMVEIPRYYYKIVDTPDYRDFIISDEPFEGSLVSPRHAPHSGNPDGYEKIYVSAYFINNNARSTTGLSSNGYVTHSRASARTACKARGAGYYMYDFATYWTIVLLYLIEVAHLNSQTAIGFGRTNSSSKSGVAGDTNNILGHTGKVSPYATFPQSTDYMKYRHLENLWGEAGHLCDGINILYHTYYICLNPEQYAAATGAPNYTALAYGISSESTQYNGFIFGTGYDPAFPFAILPISASSTVSAKSLPDKLSHSSGPESWGLPRFGGSYNNGTGTNKHGYAGLFCCDCIFNEDLTFGATRLIYLPPTEEPEEPVE